MLNAGGVVPEADLQVLDGIELHGEINVDDAQLLANVRSAIRRPVPQIRPQAPNASRVVLVGGGPSLEETFEELRALYFDGAKVVTVNGAYQWCLDRNIRPSMQVVMDARPTNARFVSPEVPHCRYVLASQCAPETWDAVQGRSDVWMFHAAAGSDGPLKDLLDTHYLGQWYGVGGGTTVISRALMLLRMVGYLRFDLFGVDSCLMHQQHHAYPQPENEADARVRVNVHPKGRPDLARVFVCAPWHCKQAEDFLQMIRINGDHFLVNVHGDGLLAYMLSAGAEMELAPSEG